MNQDQPITPDVVIPTEGTPQYSYGPRRLDGGDVFPCPADQAEFWGVYRFDAEGYPQHFLDMASEADAQVLINYLRGQDADKQPGIPEAPATPTFHYSMVLGEVIFHVGAGEIQSRRIQTFSKSTTPLYPAHRMAQIQHSLSMQNLQELGNPKDYHGIEVLLLAIIPLGEMTDEFFWAGMPKATPAEGVPLPAGDNVTPFRR